MSEKDQALLWGIRMVETDDWYRGEGDPDHDGVVVWDGQTYDEGEALAYQIGGEMRPYLTLGQVMEIWLQERNKTLASAPSSVSKLLDMALKLGGL